MKEFLLFKKLFKIKIIIINSSNYNIKIYYIYYKMLHGIIFPSSSTVTLEILESLNNKSISTIGVNSYNNYEFKELFTISYNDCPIINENENGTIEYLLNVAKNHNCNFIIPTMDYSHLILSKYIDLFNTHNIKIITSSY